MKNETAYKKFIEKLKPTGVWWWNIPTQLGKAGIRPPFDTICCVNGMMVGIEFKWERYLAKPHQRIALGKVYHAGGLGLLICGEEEGHVTRVYIYPYTAIAYTTMKTTHVWPHIFDLVSNRS